MIEAIIEAQHTLCARLETLRNLEESSPAELRLRMSMLRFGLIYTRSRTRQSALRIGDRSFDSPTRTSRHALVRTSFPGVVLLVV